MRIIGLRLAKLVVVVFVISLATFFLTKLLPGDPVVQILGPESSDPEAYAAVAEDLGLDKPLVEQYLSYIGGVVQGDLGQSYQNNLPVTTLLGQRLPVTIEILILVQVLSLAVAIPLGIISAQRQGSRLDRVITSGTFGMLSFPNFALAVILVFFFAVEWQLLPAAGYARLTEDLGENLKSLVLPVVILSFGLIATYTRLLRSDMITTLQEDYILVAKAKGLPNRRILLRHALRPSSFSLLTVAGINLGTLIGGTVIIEFIFSLPGIGLLMVSSIGRRDYLVVQGVVLVVAVTFVVANFLVDMAYSVLDPRIRRG